MIPRIENDSKDWLSFFNLTSRIVLCWKFWLKEMSHSFTIWPKELNPFLNMSQRIEPLFLSYDSKFFLDMTQKIELFLTNDSKNWTFFQKMTHRNWKKSQNTTQKYDSKNWTCFWKWLTELKLFFSINSRNELFWKKPKELDIFLTCLEELNLFSEMTLRIGPVS